MPLSLKQVAFVRQYLVDLNATAAATRAGYSAKTAMQQGSRLLKNREVATAIAEAQQRRIEKVDIKAEDVLRRLKHFADLEPDGEITRTTDVLKALELLARHLGLLRDKVELTGKDGGPLTIEVVEYMEPE